MRRRIKKAHIKYISLVPQGANQMPVLYKEDGEIELQTLVKEQDEGELLAVVYAPDFEDSQGDIASAEVIKDAAYEAMKRGVELDIRHDFKALSKDQAYVAESFLIQKGDERFQGFQDYRGNTIESLEGAWATVIKIDDPALREKYRNGEFQGVSMAGPAEVEVLKEEDPIDHLLAKLADRLSKPSPSEEIELTKEEMEALLAQRDGDLLSKIDEKLASLNKEADQADDSGDTPDEINLRDPKQVAKQIEKLQAAELAKAVDTNDLESMLALQKALGEEKPDVQDRLGVLEKSFTQILKGSNVSAPAEKPTQVPEMSWSHSGLTKEDLSAVSAADAILARMGVAPEKN